MVSAGSVPSAPAAPAETVPDTGLTVAAVARRIGVAPATLRTWDRRYGLGPSAHTAGSHRRYTADDLARLEHMRRLVLDGVPPSDAARVAAQGPGAAAGEGAGEARWGGGQVVAIPGGSSAARGLARAAMSLDGQAVSRIVEETVDRYGVVWTWDNLLVPVLVGVGQRWEATGQGIEVEHLLSETITGVMRGVTQRLREPVNSRVVLLACVDEDLHSLPLFVLAAALSERRLDTCVLGARVPTDALVAAVRRVGPGVVVLWSQIPGPDGSAVMPSLPEMRPAPTLLSAGPGWSDAEQALPRHLKDLSSGLTAISAAVGH